MRKLSKKMCAIVLSAMLAVSSGCGSANEKNDETEYVDIEDVYVDSDICSESAGLSTYDYACIDPEPGYVDGNSYDSICENSWMSVKEEPKSSFGADVDTASYCNIRNYINNGYEIDPDMVRIEEMINYFQYDYEKPENGEKFGVTTEVADCPWNDSTKLALVSLTTEDIDFSDAPSSNIVFLIDTSGSMFDEDKLPLIQQSLVMLAENFTEKDRISVVTYAGEDTVVLDGVAGNDYQTIREAIEGLSANGSTNGSAGIETAYELACENYIEGGNNRVILATDGDLNVGITSKSGLEQLITEKKQSGVFLSVIGVGYGNLQDDNLETLADKGNGTYSYIDSIYEARKCLVENLGASLVTVAKDVKLQMDFDDSTVSEYRLIGYENRVMSSEDFDDDTKDGGEMGAGHSVTALYELKLKNNASMKNLFTLNVRYKDIESDKSCLETYSCDKSCYSKEGSDNLRWAAAVAAFGMELKGSEYKGDADEDLILELATGTLKKDYADSELSKYEFLDLVRTYYEYY